MRGAEDKYDSRLNELLKLIVRFRTGGYRHILDSVLRAFQHLHSRKVGHTGIHPRGLSFLRGTAHYKEHWVKFKSRSDGHHAELNQPQPSPAGPLEVTYQFPAFSEVRRYIANERFFSVHSSSSLSGGRGGGGGKLRANT